MSQHLLKSHVSIIEFAELKKVYPNSVYSAIQQGKIEFDFVGKAKHKMIDLGKYRKYKFRVHNPDKTTLKAWYARKGKRLSENQ